VRFSLQYFYAITGKVEQGNSKAGVISPKIHFLQAEGLYKAITMHTYS